MAGISAQIILDSALSERFPDALATEGQADQPRWRWYAQQITLNDGRLCALLIEADTGYLLMLPQVAETAGQFGLDVYEELLISLKSHPDIYEQPHDGVLSFDPDPDSIVWEQGAVIDHGIQRRLSDVARQVSSMNLDGVANLVAELNSKEIVLSHGSLVPIQAIDERLEHYADLYAQYLSNTSLLKQIWNLWFNKRSWVK